MNWFYNNYNNIKEKNMKILLFSIQNPISAILEIFYYSNMVKYGEGLS